MAILPLVIVAMFFWPQERVTLLLAGWLGGVLLRLSIVAEVRLIVIWGVS
jgi:hypothetical protein